MDKAYRTLHVIADRPKVVPGYGTGQAQGLPIPPEYLIMNAPRPICASYLTRDAGQDNPMSQPIMELAAWNGDFCHGVFYVAISPQDTRALAENIGLDAWVIVYHSESEAIAYGRAYCEKHHLFFNDYEPRDFRESFLQYVDRKSFLEHLPHENES